jgi:fructokinase
MLTVLGEALIDLVADPDGRYTAHPGGSPLNVAVGLARLGHPTEFMARFSADGFGRTLRNHATGNGVRLSAAPRVTEPTTLAVVSLDEQGRAEYEFYLQGTADWQWNEPELEAMPPSTLFHTGSLASWIAPGAQRINDLTARLRAHGDTLLSYDPNFRPLLMADLEGARRLVERNVADTHIVKCSEEDLAHLYPDDSIDSVLDRWLELRTEIVVVTRGGDGAIARTRSGEIERPGLTIDLVDTIGAGDAFMAGLISGFTDVGVLSPGDLADATESQLNAALDSATLVAALTCERAGAQPPTRKQFEAARPRLDVNAA